MLPPLQPFAGHPENPSWLAVAPLTDTVLTSDPKPLSTPSSDPPRPSNPAARAIAISTSLIPVTYTSSLSLVPPLHTTPASYDLVIHVGVGLNGKIRLEQRARRFGYNKKGVDGELAEKEKGENGRRGFVGKKWEVGSEKGEEEQLRTRVEGEKVLRWVRERGLEAVELSEDAGELIAGNNQAFELTENVFLGLYLCEFTFFASLASARRTAIAAGDDEKTATPVQFIHVPP